MFGDWFNCREIDELVDSIVADLVKRFPPGGLGGMPAEKAAKRLKGVHNAAFNRVDTFARSRRLNLYKKRSEERRVGKECRSRWDWSSDVCSSDLHVR